jgi:hypothetical protein
MTTAYEIPMDLRSITSWGSTTIPHALYIAVMSHPPRCARR